MDSLPGVGVGGQSAVWAGRPENMKIRSVKLSSLILGGFISFTRVNLKIWAHLPFDALLHRRSFCITYERPNERFTTYVLQNTINVCWNPQHRALFSETIDLRGHMPRFKSKNEHFPIYLLRNPIDVCWNPQNSAHFSKTIDLRGHMPRFTLKINVFPPMSLETP